MTLVLLFIEKIHGRVSGGTFDQLSQGIRLCRTLRLNLEEYDIYGADDGRTGRVEERIRALSAAASPGVRYAQ